FRSEAANPVSRLLRRAYHPVASLAVRARHVVLALALGLFAVTIPFAMRLGSEFMPPLDEGSLLVMPTTFAGISIEEARQALNYQHRTIMGFPEVETVHGKAGRADTATDPAQLDMIESTITLRPRHEWPKRPHPRWYSSWAPPPVASVLRIAWPDTRTRTLEELARDMGSALRMPGYQMAIAPPIRTRIDMLTTGVRTPVGIKVQGADLGEIERLSVELEGMLRDVPGTRSTFADRQSGREYIDVTPDREAIARYGLTVRDVNDVLESAVGGMPVSTVIDGRSRFSINLRYGADFRADPEALRSLLVPVKATEPIAEPDIGGAGQGAASAPATGASGAMDAAASSGGGMGGMGAPRPNMTGAISRTSSVSGMSSGGFFDPIEIYRQPRPTVPLGTLADIRVVSGPPMIKDEDGLLVGYVYADIDLSERDLGGWVEDAKHLVAERLELPAGYGITWTGQYEFLEAMQDRMAWIVPIA
ncbi:MAG: efflux RND transporter permease subunit, partial [Polyangiaceae bacterium]|nr:efflux RND transporter permease subunit [Polyangiaceae bacterium]